MVVLRAGVPDLGKRRRKRDRSSTKRRPLARVEQLERRELLAALVGEGLSASGDSSNAPCDASDYTSTLLRSPLIPVDQAGSSDSFIGPINQIESPAESLSELLSESVAAAAAVSVSIGDASVVEGHAGERLLEFDVTLSAVASQSVTVNAQLVGESADELVVERIASGLSEPIYVTAAPGDPDSMFIVEQDGVIKKLNLTTNTVAPTPFLTVSGLSVGGERGLLGLAFHPEYETNRRFFIYMTDSNSDSLVREYISRPDGQTADPNSARRLLGFDQPFGNHNGGWIDFGPDGYLYIASGDGGSGFDPGDNAQDTTDNLLGKLLRIDVDGDDFPSDGNRNYAIPTSNPFVDELGDDEIWAFGLRNPWRNSFDRTTGDLLIGDVGQRLREEINLQPAASLGGENYGWRDREGTIQTPDVGLPKPPDAIDPIYDYRHGSGSTEGFSVTGGYVYRGPIEELHGNYFFADYVNAGIWSIRPNSSVPQDFDGTNYDDFTDWTSLLTPNVGSIRLISSFGEDAVGNLYILDRGGEIFRISEGADYKRSDLSVTIGQGQTIGKILVDVIGDRLPEPTETIRVELTSAIGATIADGVATGTIFNDDAPHVADVAIGDIANGRSVIEEVNVTFDSAVQLDSSGGDIFQLINLDSLSTVNVLPSITIQPGGTLLSLRFAAGPSVEQHGADAFSLADGRYQLTINSMRVQIGGVALDGNSDGTAGGEFVFGDDAADQFFRLFGDSDADGDVDGQDYGRLGLTFQRVSPDSAFNPAFDFDRDGDVDGQDYGWFVQRFLKRIGN